MCVVCGVPVCVVCELDLMWMCVCVCVCACVPGIVYVGTYTNTHACVLHMNSYTHTPCCI